MCFGKYNSFLEWGEDTWKHIGQKELTIACEKQTSELHKKNLILPILLKKIDYSRFACVKEVTNIW